MSLVTRSALAIALLAVGLAALLPPAGVHLCLCRPVPMLCPGPECGCPSECQSECPRDRGEREANRSGCQNFLVDSDDFPPGVETTPSIDGSARTPLPESASGSSARASVSLTRWTRYWTWPPPRDPLAVQRLIVLRI